jgi:hypothetical protein
MSDNAIGIAIFALVLSPLFIPTLVTVIDGVGRWRATQFAASRATEPQTTNQCGDRVRKEEASRRLSKAPPQQPNTIRPTPKTEQLA